jgi:hypothetical protein
MGRPPPPDEACELAFKLLSQRQSLPTIRKELNLAGYDVKSNTTVSDWAARGAALEEYTKIVEDRMEEYRGLDRDQERWLLAKSLDQAMAIVWDTIALAEKDPDTKPQLLQIAFSNLRWMMDMRAKITNAWAPPHPKQVEVSGDVNLPVPPEELQPALEKTAQLREQQVEQYRNGLHREA